MNRYFLDIADVHGTMAFRKNITYGKNIENCSCLMYTCTKTSHTGIYMQNVTVGLDQNCLNKYDCADEWRCFFAPVCYIQTLYVMIKFFIIILT